jgi:hypothetical protein
VHVRGDRVRSMAEQSTAKPARRCRWEHHEPNNSARHRDPNAACHAALTQRSPLDGFISSSVLSVSLIASDTSASARTISRARPAATMSGE